MPDFTEEQQRQIRQDACELAGWCAAARGDAFDDNPHSDDEGRAWWENGWHRYRAEMAA